MICKICKNTLTNRIKIRYGSICQSCYEKLPKCARENIQQFSSGQIKKLLKLFTRPQARSWAVLNWFKISDKAIQFSGREIQLEDLKNISLQFHPTGYAGNGMARGRVTLVIETKKPRIILEEELFEYDSALPYMIQGKNIIYEYPEELKEIVEVIRDALEKETFDISYYRPVFQERKKRKRDEKQKEQKRKQNNQYWQNNKQQNSRSSRGMTLPQAMLLFHVTIPFKESEIKKVRNQLLKNAHPDVEGFKKSDENFTKEVNLAYDLLKKYAERG